MPRLLVSVRDATEAYALRGSSCAIVDVKEPAHGPLGAADSAVIREVAACRPDGSELSVALGEVRDFGTCEIPKEVTYIKFGLAGLRDRADWVEQWMAARNAVSCQTAVRSVGVIYADAAQADAPEPMLVVRASADTGCAVVLIDTFTKKPGGGLFDHLSVDQVRGLGRAVRERGMAFAIAGQLRLSDTARIAEVAPDIVGIRGAACRSLDRTAQIDPCAVGEFVEALRDLSPTGA